MKLVDDLNPSEVFFVPEEGLYAKLSHLSNQFNVLSLSTWEPDWLDPSMEVEVLGSLKMHQKK